LYHKEATVPILVTLFTSKCDIHRCYYRCRCHCLCNYDCGSDRDSDWVGRRVREQKYVLVMILVARANKGLSLYRSMIHIVIVCLSLLLLLLLLLFQSSLRLSHTVANPYRCTPHVFVFVHTANLHERRYALVREKV